MVVLKNGVPLLLMLPVPPSPRVRRGSVRKLDLMKNQWLGLVLMVLPSLCTFAAGCSQCKRKTHQHDVGFELMCAASNTSFSLPGCVEDLAKDFSKHFHEVQEHRPTKKLRRTKSDLQWYVHRDPTMPNHCLFAALAYYLDLEEDTSSICLLRQLCAGAWSQRDKSWLGMTLCDIAASVRRSPKQYVAEILRERWGGYREAVIIAETYDLHLRIWNLEGELLIQRCSDKWNARKADLVYTGKHYIAASPHWTVALEAIPAEVRMRMIRIASAPCHRRRQDVSHGRDGLEKKCQDKTGLSALTREKMRRPGRTKMSPIWWAKSACDLVIAHRRDRKKQDKREEGNEEWLIFPEHSKIHEGQSFPLPSPPCTSRESCAECTDSRLHEVCHAAPGRARVGPGGMPERQGDNGPAMKARVVAKLNKENVQDAGRLVNMLWNLDQRCIREARGQADQVRKAIMDAATRHGISAEADSWRRDKDPVYEQDPWNRAAREADEEQIKTDKVELRSMLLTKSGDSLAQRQMSEMQQDANFTGVVVVHPRARDDTLHAARVMKGPIVFVCKSPSTQNIREATYKRVQLVTRSSANGMWKAGVWRAYTFSAEEVQLAQKAVAVPMPAQKQVSVVAELRESRCDQPMFIKFCKPDDLSYLGIPTALFQPLPVRCYGDAPERMAKMKGSVPHDKVEQVMKESGKGQVTLRLEFLGEEKQMGLLLHFTDETDSVKLRS